MRGTEVRKRGMLLLLLVGVVGCAAAGRGGAGGTQQGAVAVEVRNNIIPGTSVTVWAAPEVGVRSLVGTVSPSQTRVLRFSPTGAARTYRLVAETTGGDPVVSNPVVIDGAGTRVVWDLRANIATVRQ